MKTKTPAEKTFDWTAFLERHRDWIISEWKERLGREVSELYAKRPSEELAKTTIWACDAFTQLLAQKDFGPINAFINQITKTRLEEGFPLTDVQKAFELYRQIVTPILVEESPKTLLCKNIEAVNTGLSYTIHRFSDHFQEMHQTHLKEYAHRLEKAVNERTTELKESEHKYRGLVQGISDGYLALYNDSISYVNPAFCRMHEVVEEDAVAASFLSFVAEEHRETVRNMIRQTPVSEKEPEAFEYLRLTTNGKRLPTEINFRPSLFKGQEYMLCILRDITRRKEMEKRNREIERMAYVGKLTTSLSHEIRNPLSSVKMNLQILSQNMLLKGNDRKRVQISEKEINRLEGILKELLDFAKPVALNLTLENINPIVCSCVELLELKFYRKSIDYNIHLDDGLPQILADKGKIEQMIINLLLNALDSVDDFGHIRISTRRKKQSGKAYAVIRVQDDGKGISKELLPHIFEPFYTTKTSGTGLGLANVKQIITAHNGKITVSNLKHSGTAFEIFLPMGDING